MEFSRIFYFIACLVVILPTCTALVETYETDMNFRVEPGARLCFFEQGKTGQVMEASYQVIDGQHGDLDISFEVSSPSGRSLASDYKKGYNSLIMTLEEDGDYVFCLDNSFSVINSKLVFVYVMIEDKPPEASPDDETSVADEDGEHQEEEVLEWTGTGPDGEPYFLEVGLIADSLARTLKHVVRARHLLDVHGAARSRDSYAAFEDTFIVDVWSAFQITFMCLVGMIQVYMIKKLFNKSSKGMNDYY